MSNTHPRKVAAQLAKYLFTDGVTNKVVDRVVLTDTQSGAGWSRQSAENAIADALEKAWPKPVENTAASDQVISVKLDRKTLRLSRDQASALIGELADALEDHRFRSVEIEI